MPEDGQMILISLDTSGSEPEISIIKANLKSRSKLLTACAYKDTSGLFTTEAPEELENTQGIIDLNSILFFLWTKYRWLDFIWAFYKK